MRVVTRLLKSVIPYEFISTLRNLKHIKKGVVLGRNVYIGDSDICATAKIGNNTVIRESNVGEMTSVGKNCNISYAKIGKFNSISWMVTIGATSHPKNHLTTNAFPYSKKMGLVNNDQLIKEKTEIGNDVWIGCNVVILPNVFVGNGAIIGAGSIVTKDVEPYSIVAGVPAKKIGMRFEQEIISEIENFKWWNIPIEELAKNVSVFSRTVDQKVIDEARKLYDKFN